MLKIGAYVNVEKDCREVNIGRIIIPTLIYLNFRQEVSSSFHTEFLLTIGQITVFDFDNACTCWYMYDLANVWLNGLGWIQFHPDASKRKVFMDDYFKTVLEGYTSETKIEESMLNNLSLFIQVNLMENIIDAFEVMKNNGEELKCDEELSYSIKCLEEDIPYKGFFHEIFSCEEPFECEERNI